MRRMAVRFPRWVRRVRWGRWLLIAAVVAAPICLLNMAVAACGRCVIFPLSPFFLKEKAQALGHYALHRPRCVFSDHPPLPGLIARAESRHRLPRGLLAAVVQIESDGRVHRISPAGAMGPGQLTHATARSLGVSDPFDPEQNLDGSARYLAAQLSRFHNVSLAVAAYNAGPGSIVHRMIPQNGETEFYVHKVMRAYHTARRGHARAG
jgi:Transglycosylase SLT domain